MKKDFDSVEMQREIREILQKVFENKPELRRKKLLKIKANYGIVTESKNSSKINIS